MAVIAVINRKGGSGKSTLATQLAGLLARRGLPVMLGDVDRQLSTVSWLKRRAALRLRGAPIVGWQVDPRNVLRPPAGVAHVVLDTPGSLQGFDLTRLLMYADAVLMPVCDSAFDRESAANCLAELRSHPRVSNERCRLAVVGMRVDARTHGEATLRRWAGAQDVAFLGVLRAAQVYVRCIEQGLTLFDMPAARVEADLVQWRPVVDWLTPVLDAPVDTLALAALRMSAAGPTKAPTPGPSARTTPLRRPPAMAINEPPRALAELPDRGSRFPTLRRFLRRLLPA